MTTGELPTTAPVVSVTVPVIVPLPLVWASKLIAGISINAIQHDRARILVVDWIIFIGWSLLMNYVFNMSWVEECLMNKRSGCKVRLIPGSILSGLEREQQHAQSQAQPARENLG
jgi:hypothetical protein